MVYDPVNESTADLGHYSTMNMGFNTGAWTGMDDDVLRRISSFTLMNKIPMLVDKNKSITCYIAEIMFVLLRTFKNNMYVVK